MRCAKPTAVTLAPEGNALDFTYHDGVCRFTVPRVEYLAVVQLEGANR